MRVSVHVVMLFACVSLAAQQPVYSIEKEAALGKHLASEALRRNSVISDSGTEAYVDRLGGKISAQMPNAQFPFTFSVTADEPCRTTHEPVALPGGYILIPAALFIAARDEAEFAGMLTHSMEHVAQRHGIRQGTRGQLAGFGSIPLVFVGGCPDAMAVPAGLAATARNDELEADTLAVETTARAGFDPKGLVRYVQRVQTQPSMRDERVDAMRQALARVPPADYAAPGAEFAAVQQEVLRLTKLRE